MTTPIINPERTRILAKKIHLAIALMRHYEVDPETLQAQDEKPLPNDMLKERLEEKRNIGDVILKNIFSDNPDPDKLVRLHNAFAREPDYLPDDVRHLFRFGQTKRTELQDELPSLEEAVEKNYPKAYADYQQWLWAESNGRHDIGGPDPAAATRFSAKEVRVALGRVLGPDHPKISAILRTLRSNSIALE